MSLREVQNEESLMGEINTTPLVDVMLVLLIIFLITIPVVTHTVPVKLPDEQVTKLPAEPRNVIIAVDKEGHWYLGEQLTNKSVLLNTLKSIATNKPQPLVQIRGDQLTPFDSIGQVMLLTQEAGIEKVAFVTNQPVKN